MNAKEFEFLLKKYGDLSDCKNTTINLFIKFVHSLSEWLINSPKAKSELNF